MDDYELRKFIDRQKQSSWGNVEFANVNGRSVREIFPRKRLNYENELIRMIDAARAWERRCKNSKR